MTNSLTPKKALEIIFDYMNQKGLVTPDMEANRQNIIDNVLNTLKVNDLDLTPDDLRNSNVQKHLMGAIISETLGLKQNSNDLIHTLTLQKEKGLTNEPNEELDKRLESGIILLKYLQEIAKTSKTLQPGSTPKLEPLLAGFLKKYDDELDEKFKDGDKKTQQLNEFEKMMGSALCNLNGGYNPLEPGEIRDEVSVELVSNALGFLYQGNPDPNNLSTIVREITFEPGPDPLGIERRTAINDLAMGIIEDIDMDSINAAYARPKYGVPRT